MPSNFQRKLYKQLSANVSPDNAHMMGPVLSELAYILDKAPSALDVANLEDTLAKITKRQDDVEAAVLSIKNTIMGLVQSPVHVVGAPRGI